MVTPSSRINSPGALWSVITPPWVPNCGRPGSEPEGLAAIARMANTEGRAHWPRAPNRGRSQRHLDGEPRCMGIPAPGTYRGTYGGPRPASGHAHPVVPPCAVACPGLGPGPVPHRRNPRRCSPRCSSWLSRGGRFPHRHGMTLGGKGGGGRCRCSAWWSCSSRCRHSPGCTSTCGCRKPMPPGQML